MRGAVQLCSRESVCGCVQEGASARHRKTPTALCLTTPLHPPLMRVQHRAALMTVMQQQHTERRAKGAMKTKRRQPHSTRGHL